MNRTMSVQLLATLLGVACVAGCGGDAGINVAIATPKVQIAQVHGTVEMPNGKVAMGPGSPLQRFAAALLPEAAALSGNVSPVGAGNQVTLVLLHGNGSQDPPAGSTPTNAQGQYSMPLPAQTGPDTCRYIFEVGSGTALTRAFVTSTSTAVDIDFASEAAVRLVLDQVHAGADLCSYTSSQLADLTASIRSLPGDVSGADAAAVNDNAYTIAVDHVPPLLPAFNTPTSRPTAKPTATIPLPTVPPAATLTFTRTIPPTLTPTLKASGTPTQTPTLTSTATLTFTATLTPTQTPTQTPTLTPTQTATSTPGVADCCQCDNPQACALPSNGSCANCTVVFGAACVGGSCSLHTPTPTSTPTQTPTETSTPTATATFTPGAGDCCQCTASCAVPAAGSCGDCTVVYGATCGGGLCNASTPTPTSTPTVTQMATFAPRSCTLGSATSALLAARLAVLKLPLSGSQVWRFGPLESDSTRAIQILPGESHFDCASTIFSGQHVKICARIDPTKHCHGGTNDGDVCPPADCGSGSCDATPGFGIIDCAAGGGNIPGYNSLVQLDHNTNYPLIPLVGGKPNLGLPADPQCVGTFMAPDGSVLESCLEPVYTPTPTPGAGTPSVTPAFTTTPGTPTPIPTPTARAAAAQICPGDMHMHPDVCNSPVFPTNSGSSPAGGLRLHETIDLTFAIGDDCTTPCPADDLPQQDGDLQLSGDITTGQTKSVIWNVANSGLIMGTTGDGNGAGICNFTGADKTCPTVAQGVPVGVSDCLSAPPASLGGTTLALAYPALDFPTIGDFVATLTLQCQ